MCSGRRKCANHEEERRRRRAERDEKDRHRRQEDVERSNQIAQSAALSAAAYTAFGGF